MTLPLHAGRALAVLTALHMATNAVCAQTIAPTPTPYATTTAAPYKIERITRNSRDGAIAGVVATINLRHPQVSVRIALTDDRDPDGDGPCSGQLATTSHAAQKHDFAITLNASFFSAPAAREVEGKSVRYFVGNCTTPQGWHVNSGRVIAKPVNDRLRAAVLVMKDGSVRIAPDLRELPPDLHDVVSGNAMVLRAGEIVAKDATGTRHPRSVVGLSADGHTLYLVAIDGRQVGYSIGANTWELGEMMKNLGAYDAVNLDGGGSTAMVVKDARTGTFGLANQPSEVSTEGFPVRMERPVADVIGIKLLPTVNSKNQK